MEKVMDIITCIIADLAFLCAGVSLAMLNADSLLSTTPGAWLAFAWLLIGVVAALYLIEQRRLKRIESASSDVVDTL